MFRQQMVQLDWNGAMERWRFTKPDFYWPKAKLALYLDGYAVHKSRGALNRADRINTQLEKQGVKVLRFTYRGRLSRNMERTICEKVEECLYPVVGRQDADESMVP
jgi:very-short-patch-repair endonuclease